ncbi:MAG: hypothetical protein LBN34_06370 [Clostridiales Family XIII bacterium]|jgi:hypothetical protein|nr:hypothetical protein [Clostridiales Family XIII bacterium]
MKTAKTKTIVMAILIIVAVAYSLVMWLVASSYDAVFIITYAVTLVSIGWLAYNITFLNDKMKNFPQNFSFVASAWTFFIIELVVSGVVLALSFADISSKWAVIIAVILQIVLLAVFIIRGLLLILGKGAIESVGGRTDAKVLDIRLMVADIEALIEQSTDFGEDTAKVKKSLTEVRDAIRYSDPMSSEGLKAEEEAIKDSVVELEHVVDEKNVGQVEKISIRILRQVKDRNNKVKSMK